MAQHGQLRTDTDLDIYFCDPQSPWQRGTNENTNGLLNRTGTPGQPPHPTNQSVDSGLGSGLSVGVVAWWHMFHIEDVACCGCGCGFGCGWGPVGEVLVEFADSGVDGLSESEQFGYRGAEPRTCRYL